MKRTIPLLITAVAGFVLIVSFFIPAYQEWGESAAVWFDILASIAFVLGGGNLLKLHLQKISDRRPGWGYSGITLVAFLLTLAFGLLKLGCPPEGNVENFGESFAPLALSELPEFTVPGSIPTRADEERLPASVLVSGSDEPLLRQGTDDDGNPVLRFRGWMLRDQKEDLLGYKESLEWKCAVETLAAAARPPEPLRGKVTYYPPHRMLAFSGYMTDDNRQTLEELFDSEAGQRAVNQLYEAARRETSITVAEFPSGFTIPDASAESVRREGNRLTVLGPVSPKLRDDIADQWPGYERVHPFSDEDRELLLASIEQLGHPLNRGQRKEFHGLLDTVWSAEQLIQVINIAGVPVPVPKTACEFLEEVQAGVADPPRDHPPGDENPLNAEQEGVVRRFVEQPGQTPEELIEQLQAAGELTDKQEEAITQFFQRQPTVGELYQQLALALLSEGPLLADQREFLFEQARREFVWRQSVGELFLAAHQEKYPWSGDYSTQGSPFWWIYAYVFQPLLTTTFAMLAFYVASAAFRAFRAKNLEAVLLLGTAFIILLGRTFAGYLLTAWVPDALSALKIDQMTVYIMGIFNTAGNRAIMIGIALGIASTSLKVLLGVDRSYLGSSDE
jgi:hypothetical protein